MGRQSGSVGWRGSVSARVAMVLGSVCAATLLLAVPAFAHDENGHDPRPTRQVAHPNDDSDGSGGGSTNDGTGTGTQASRNGQDDGHGASGTARNDAGDTDPNLVPGTPCTKAARACVELKSQQAWLIDQTGAVTHGPVPVSSGGPGEETPVGTFTVQWKDKNHKSNESKLPTGAPAPMPYSVFFTNTGVAFHGGSLTRASAGCVHLNDADAVLFYNTLKLGDQVQVH